MTTHGLGRRHALAGAAGLGLGLPVLAACGGDSADDSAEDPTADPGAGGESDGQSGDGAGEVLGATDDVPVGSGTIFADQKVVVTQPSEGEFKAFTAVCTHQGCLVGQVEGEEILCPCHGSRFSTADGSVIDGPATAPLEEVALSVEGDQISLG